jgi:hypothetical protein
MLGYLTKQQAYRHTLTVTERTQASSFVTESDNHGGTMVVAETSQTASQLLLTASQHA